MTRQIHQLLPTLAYGDAIGNHVLELRQLFRENGYQSEIFAERWHPKLGGTCRPFREYDRVSGPDNVVLLHYSTGGDVNTYAMNLPDQVLLYYHNITPPHFFYDVNGEFARRLMEARAYLAEMAGKVPVIAASPYNANELRGFGFDVVGVAPPFIHFRRLHEVNNDKDAEEFRKRFGKYGTFDWLSVGRLSPNKRISDIIKAFYYYQRWIDADSRLLLVGTSEGTENYVTELYRLVSQLELDGSVVFVGQVPHTVLPFCYQMADIYICMSEHEGFCLPLLEAMHFGVPVVAYASTAVPDTMGDAGMLIRRKEPALVAEAVHEIAVNTELRQQLVAGQRARLSVYLPEAIKSQIMTILQPFLHKVE